MADKGSGQKSILGMSLRHPFRILGAVSRNNIRMFLRTAHYSGFRAAMRTTAHVLNNSMDDYDRAGKASVYLDGMDVVPDVLTVPPCDDPLVSIVIPVYNQYRFTMACVNSVIRNSGDVPYEVIIGDDGSTDETVDIDSHIVNARIVREGSNKGFILNCNSAAGYAKGKYVLFLNNDTLVGEDWLSPLVSLAESDGRIGAVGSKLVYPDGKLQEAGGIIWSDGTASNYGKGDNPNDSEFNYVKEVDYVSGASLMVRREIFESLGGFDVRYVPAYCEDSDLCIAIRDMGYRVLYQPRSVVIHFEGMTHGKKSVKEAVNPYQEANMAKLREKWGEYLKRNCCRPGSDMFHARDRSVGRKTVLFVTSHLPSDDMDSGSRAVFGYISSMVGMGYNVKLSVGDFHYDETYAMPLQDMGVEIYYGIEVRDNWKRMMREHRKDFDHIIVVGYSCASRFLLYIEKHTKAKVHYLFRENLQLGLEREYGLTHDSSALLRLATVKRRIPKLLAAADDVIVYTDEDEDYVSSVSPKAVTVRMRYTSLEPAPHFDSIRNSKDMLFVGFMGSRPEADAMEWFCTEILPLILEKVPDARLRIAGAVPPEMAESLGSENVVFEGHLANEGIRQLYSSCGVFVNPMRMSAGVRGYLLDAVNACIPVVSTSTGIEGSGLHLGVYDDARSFADEVVRILLGGMTDGVGDMADYLRSRMSSQGLSDDITIILK